LPLSDSSAASSPRKSFCCQALGWLALCEGDGNLSEARAGRAFLRCRRTRHRLRQRSAPHLRGASGSSIDRRRTIRMRPRLRCTRRRGHVKARRGFSRYADDTQPACRDGTHARLMISDRISCSPMSEGGHRLRCPTGCHARVSGPCYARS
jgi:hypothetical protein